MRKGLLVVIVCLLSLVMFVGLAMYGWNRRFGPTERSAPQPFPTLRVPHVAKSLELGPNVGPADGVWKDVPRVTMALMHQVMEKPWPKSHVPAVSVQAFHDGSSVYFRLSWKDDRADMRMIPGAFADACSVALPLKGGMPPRSIMMGFSSLVNFWHWRADVDAEFWHGKSPAMHAYADHHNPFEKKEVDPVILTEVRSAVSDMLASRPGSLTRKDHQIVQGAGTWTDGVWSVVFKRALKTNNADSDSQLESGKHAAAFAVWDGGHKDRGARKSLSDWLILDIAPTGKGGASGAGHQAALFSSSVVAASLALTTAEAPETETPRVITVIAKRFEFEPSMIELQKGELVTLRLESLDVTHGLYLDGYGIRLKARPGMVGKATFRADRTGRFSFRCAETCGEFHPYMIGYLSVAPNSRFHIFVIVAVAAFVVLGAVFAVSTARYKRKLHV